MPLIENIQEIQITLENGKVLHFKTPQDKISVRKIETTINNPNEKPTVYLNAIILTGEIVE